ncbi:GAF domain-containing protein, partial [Pseudonocardia sp. KRD291]|uniref:GAF domain-containing protein n=1 Tax=Pseudonocardia sp. KRD291 TaxID=2792007 RepID=UPI001C49D7DF
MAAELVALLWGADRLDEFLTEIAREAAGTVADAISCGITVQSPAWPRLLAATSDEFARQMDEIQYSVDDGPCLTCLREGEIVEVTDIAADQRWPAFRRRGRQQGAGASLSIPL